MIRPLDHLADSLDDMGLPRRPGSAQWSSRNQPPKLPDHMLLALLVIALGAALGAVLRWYLSIALNHLFPNLPPGTLMSNLLGGYLIGVAMAVFLAYPALPQQWRLFVVTGFLGGLTTFSSFSAEVVTALLEARLVWAFATIAVHVVGSVAMTLLGIGTVGVVRAWR